MTVCVAAICDGNTIIGASDRMVTGPEMLFQPNQAKTRQLTSSIVVMWSGDSALQAEIIDRLKADVLDHLAIKPDEWLAVHWVAEQYEMHWSTVRRERAERAILWPLGLTQFSFLDRQATMAPELVKDIANGLVQFAIPSASGIIAGVDASGAHLYHFDNGALQCMDLLGFAYIGSGGRHAASQLMLDQYGPLTPTPEALLLVHSAKRRAEVAPGVGSDTDLWIVGPQLGTWAPIANDLHAELDRQYVLTKRAEERALQKSKNGILKFIEKLVKPMAPKPDAQGMEG